MIQSSWTPNSHCFQKKVSYCKYEYLINLKGKKNINFSNGHPFYIGLSMGRVWPYSYPTRFDRVKNNHTKWSGIPKF